MADPGVSYSSGKKSKNSQGKKLYDFSEDSVLLVLASTHYNGQEYIRDYESYREIMKNEVGHC